MRKPNTSREGTGAFTRRRFVTTLAVSPFVAGLADPPDRAPDVLSRIDDASDLSVLTTMIRTRSYSGGGEEGTLARIMVDEMQALGMECELIEVEPGRFNAVGRLKGRGGGTSLMLNGHLDTNPVGLDWTVDPFEGLVRDGMIYGIGVSNMKASCAAFLGAVRAIVSSGYSLRGDLLIAYVVGELQGGIGTLELLRRGIKADTFIAGEPTDLALLTLHAGAVTIEVNTLGVTRHLSKAEESVSAVETMLLVIDRIRRMEFSGPDDPEFASVRRVNIGSMRAGLGREYHDWRPGQVPDFATIRMSVRFGPGQTRESILDDIEGEMAALAEENPRVRTEVLVRSSDTLPPPKAFHVDRDAAIVRATADACERVLGSPAVIGAIPPYRYYASDASHLQHVGGMQGVVCGAGGKYNTMPDERVEVSQFHAATRIYALSALRICG